MASREADRKTSSVQSALEQSIMGQLQDSPPGGFDVSGHENKSVACCKRELGHKAQPFGKICRYLCGYNVQVLNY
jgi:hypothetical protein